MTRPLRRNHEPFHPFPDKTRQRAALSKESVHEPIRNTIPVDIFGLIRERRPGLRTEPLGVRYQVKDVRRAVDFYTQKLGFKLDQKHLPAFAQVSSGNLKLILSGPGASGSRPMPDGHAQEPGGWNRVVLQIADLPARIETLKTAGLHFRNQMEVGPGGKQILLEDPDGNPIELFEPAG